MDRVLQSIRLKPGNGPIFSMTTERASRWARPTSIPRCRPGSMALLPPTNASRPAPGQSRGCRPANSRTLERIAMMKSLVAALFIAMTAGPAIAAPVVIHDYDHLALSPKADRVADVESDDPGNLPDDPH